MAGRGRIYQRGTIYYIAYRWDGREYRERARSPVFADAAQLLARRLADAAQLLARRLAERAGPVSAGVLTFDDQGFFEHAEYEAVRRHLPPPYQDVLDFAYYSGWRKREIFDLQWSEVDAAGGVVRLSPERSKTRVGRVLPISAPIAAVLTRRRAQRHAGDRLVFRRDRVTVRAWRTAWGGGLSAGRRAGAAAP